MKINSYLKKYNNVFNGIMGKIKEVDNDERDYEKVKLNLI